MSTLDHLNSWTKKTFSDVTFGERREVDLVAKLKFENRDAFFLIHVENQAQVQPEFGNRMHTYFARLHEKHALPVYPIAVFTYDSPRTEQPDIYRIEFPDRVVLDFRYRVVQLNRLNWRDFAKRENPVASALMAKMNIAPTDRPRVKLECIRLLAGLRLNKAKMQVILGFVDTYLRLDEKETGTYELELEKLAPAEKETMMEVTMSWREQALQEGLQQGVQQGLQQGLHRMILLVTHQIEKLLGPIDAERRQEISKLDADQIEKLAASLLDFHTLDDLTQWLREA